LAFRSALGISGSALVPAPAVLDAALADTGLTVITLAPQDPLLGGADGVLDRQMGCIWQRSGLQPANAVLLVAHEVGHWRLHSGIADFADGAADTGGLWLSSSEPLTEVDGYSPAERREVEANAFALELLAPIGSVREAFLEGATARNIADSLGVSERVVVRQLTLGVLEGLTPDPVEEAAPSRSLELDDEQLRASRSPAKRTVVVSGPGTGKTRALTGRIVHLLDGGTAPERVLAVTFSRNAADELRWRLRDAVGSLADRVGVYTLHGYGLELLRRYGHHIGLPAEPQLMDRLGSLRVLENVLAQGHGGELEYLDAPMRPLPDLLHAVVTWKERRIGPDGVLSEPDETGTRRAAARVYRLYESELRRRGALDFPDMIGRSIELLRSSAEARHAVHAEIEHVLVDELQDMDPASLELIDLLTGDGGTLWMVGDPMQAIYAFRGAVGMDLAHETGGASRDTCVLRLRKGYRCAPQITEAANALAAELRLSGDRVLDACGSDAKCVLAAAIADNEQAEACGIAEWAREFHASGVRFGDQAVLCRTNNQAYALADRLRAFGVPVTAPATALDSPMVREAIRRTMNGEGDDAEDLQEVGEASEALARVLFGCTGLARKAAVVGDQADRGGLAWLLQMAERARDNFVASAESDNGGKDAFAWMIRRAITLGDDRLMPFEGSTEQDAVRIMTIHASKGLEFDAVFVPHMNAGRFPPKGRPSVLGGHGAHADTGSAFDQQEARLLYVAASRARRFLIGSACATIGGRQARLSPLFCAFREAVRRAGGVELVWTGQPAGCSPRTTTVAGSARVMVSAGNVEMYERCPMRYRLSSESEPVSDPCGAYGAYVGALRMALRALRGSVNAGSEKAVARAFRTWTECWMAYHGGAGWSVLYGKRAAEIIRAAMNDRSWMDGEFAVPLELDLEHGKISVQADRVAEAEGKGIIVERFVFRGRRKNPPSPRQTAALWLASTRRWPGATVRVAYRFMASGEIVDVTPPRDGGKAVVAHYERVLSAIRQGLFYPKPDEQCGCCPYVFVCTRGHGALGDGGVEGSSEEHYV
jgi:superfamily I DNA/RNA helicase